VDLTCLAKGRATGPARPAGHRWRTGGAGSAAVAWCA